MHEINLDREEWKICRNFVEDIRMGGKPEKLRKAGHSTVYRTDEWEEDEEEAEGIVLRYGGEDFSIVPVVYPRVMVSVS